MPGAHLIASGAPGAPGTQTASCQGLAAVRQETKIRKKTHGQKQVWHDRQGGQAFVREAKAGDMGWNTKQNTKQNTRQDLKKARQAMGQDVQKAARPETGRGTRQDATGGAATAGPGHSSVPAGRTEQGLGATLQLPEHFTLTEEFARVFDLLEHTRHNVFITGRAGTGKSTLLTYFRRRTAKNIVLLAPTGIAAVTIGAQTIHSFFRLPIRLLNDLERDVQPSSRLRRIAGSLDMVIVDEVSMVRADVLDAMDYSLRLNRNCDAPFGGLQMVFFGDLFQLPPVVAGRDLEHYFAATYGGPYFFNARSFAARSFVCVELQHIFRQKDRLFIDLLNSIREKTCTARELVLLNSRVVSSSAHGSVPGSRPCGAPSAASLAGPGSPASSESLVMSICATNSLADQINAARMAALTTPEHVYEADIEGDFEEKYYPTEYRLTLRVGAQVMMLRNDPGQRWVNGSLGVVEKLSDREIAVRIQGSLCILERVVWEAIEYSFDPASGRIAGQVKGSFIQYPLKPAWAITIHKSQGQTFERVHIDLGRGAFAHGQTYVALSRCTSLEGITLGAPIRPRDVLVDDRVRAFMASLAAQKLS